jgi:hypothetical protein
MTGWSHRRNESPTEVSRPPTRNVAGTPQALPQYPREHAGYQHGDPADEGWAPASRGPTAGSPPTAARRRSSRRSSCCSGASRERRGRALGSQSRDAVAAPAGRSRSSV